MPFLPTRAVFPTFFTLLLTVASAANFISPNPTPLSDPRPEPTVPAAASRRPKPKYLSFQDETILAGIQIARTKLKKYGGPTIADLNNDGYPDMLFCHHDSFFAEIYFNNRRGHFVKHAFRLWTDMHALIVVPRSVYSRTRRLTIVSGGNFGKNPSPPRMYHVNGKAITQVTHSVGIHKIGGRGRTAVFMHLKKNNDHRHPDILYTNARPRNRSEVHHFGYFNRGAAYELRRLPGYEFDMNWYAMPTDIDGDGIMELVSFHKFTVYKLIAPFTFRDITASVLNVSVPRVGTVAVAEFDFDNDGDFDLYVARTNTGDLSWVREKDMSDLLLENRDGRYVDVSEQAGIPRNTQSRGVTTGDFNNDGLMDIFVPQYIEDDILLMNRGDGRFERVKIGLQRPAGVRGDHAVAADLDLDGRVDLVVAQGDQHIRALGGSYRIFRNRSRRKRHLLVRVGHAPDRSATALHAVVTVHAGPLKMTRRVGSPGDAVSRSFLETVHFGTKWNRVASFVRVKWTSGFVQVKHNVTTKSIVDFGVI